MTKNEYLSQFSQELDKRKITDSAEIISEYEQHFIFKMADGFSEEEISAKLGDPSALAAGFELGGTKGETAGKKIVTIIGLAFSDFFAGIFFILMFVWEIVMAAFSLCAAAIAVCLFLRQNIKSLIPPVPYGPGVVFAIAFAALAVLTAVGCFYFIAFIRQLMRSYGRFHHNTRAAASRRATLPGLAAHPQLTAGIKRRIRSVALFAAVLFVVCCIIGFIIAMLLSGSIEFWHTWNWFV